MSPIKTVAVFCGREYGPRKDFYQDLALSTGKLLADNGFVTATGGGPGMMSDVNEGAITANGQVISVQFGFSDGKQSPFFTTKYHYEDLRERQKFLLGLADALFVLPGGVGTLYESIEVLSMKRINKTPMDMPLIFIGNEQYQPLYTMLKHMEKEAFLPFPVDGACAFVNTPAEAIELLKKSS